MLDMDNCRVSKDEEEHDREIEQVEARREAISDVLAEKVEERYQTLIDDPLWLWEALGPDGFVAPNGKIGIFFDIQNRAAEIDYQQKISSALRSEDWLELGTLMGSMAKDYLKRSAENHVDANWSDYE
jgi:hypothetical protein